MRRTKQRPLYGFALNPDFYLPAGLVVAGLLFSLATLDRSSYWLNFDTPTQAVEGIDLATGCWDYASGKPAVILTLALVYSLVGASPLRETAVLVGLMAVTLLAVYYLALRLSRSRVVAAVAGLVWLSLPAQLYYSRMHVGHPIAWLTLGVLAFSARRWRLAGFYLMFSLMAHGTFTLPVGLFMVASVIGRQGPKTLNGWLQFAGFMLLPWVLYEAADYAFTGVLFEWTRGTIRWFFFYQNTFQQTNWLHVWESVRLTNGTPLAILLVTSVVYPALRRGKNDIGLALYVTALGMLGLYTVRAGLTQSRFIPRAIAGAYPLVCVLGTVTLATMVQRGWRRLPAAIARPVFRIVAAGVALVMFLAFTRNILVLREFSRTGFPAAESAFREAARQGQPVRYWGNQWSALFFAKLYGVQTAVDDPDVEVAAADTQAILVFEGDGWTMKDSLASRRGLYETSTTPHLRTNVWPAGVETEVPTPQMAEVRRRYQQGPAISQVEIWRPIKREGTFNGRSDVGRYTYYYSGTGCVVAPRYGNGTLHWYQVVLNKARDLLRLRR